MKKLYFIPAFLFLFTSLSYSQTASTATAVTPPVTVTSTTTPVVKAVIASPAVNVADVMNGQTPVPPTDPTNCTHACYVEPVKTAAENTVPVNASSCKSVSFGMSAERPKSEPAPKQPDPQHK